MADKSKYRVDVSQTSIVPCGMNALRYLGSSFTEAKKAFANTETGKNAWGEDNCTYGVILSVWDGKDYITKMQKGI